VTESPPASPKLPVNRESPALPLGHEPARFFGPGLISAASDNDPTTVATLAFVGATTGYAFCWLVVLVVPMIALVQALAARVGAVCKTSLQGAIRKNYGLRWAIVSLSAVGVVNLITLVADVRAGSEAIGLLTNAPAEAFIIPFAALVGWLLLGRSYHRVERVLSLLPLAFIAYAFSAIVAHADFGAFARSLLYPHVALSGPGLAATIAILGTTLTSYVYMWESIGVAEGRAKGRGNGNAVDAFGREAIRGVLIVGVIFIFIVMANAETLGRNHLPIQTAADAARALAPVAGAWSRTLFALGLLGSAMLAVPVLASTTAYMASHTFGWSGSLDAAPRDSKAFYAVIAGSLALAAGVAFVPVALIPLLNWASMAGGLATPLTLYFLVRVAADRGIMGAHRIGTAVSAAVWTILALVTAAGAGYVISLFSGAA